MTNRKQVHAELNKNRHKDIQEMANMEVENRDKKFKPSSNRYDDIIENRKKEKREREEEKKHKLYLGKNKHIEKRAIAEVEEQN